MAELTLDAFLRKTSRVKFADGLTAYNLCCLHSANYLLI